MIPALLGLGTALPRHRFTQAEALAHALACADPDPRQRRLIETLYRRTGIEQRGSVLLDDSAEGIQRFARFPPQPSPPAGASTAERMADYARHAPPLATDAARAALSDAQAEAREISHIVSVSCTGFFAPGLDAALIRNLGLRPTVQRTHVGFMGCHGALNGLQVARAIVRAEPSARVLLCAVELCSLHFQYGFEHAVPNSLFADGSAAVVLGASDGRPAWRVTDAASVLLPESADAMSWRIGDHGFEMSLSPRVPDLIAQHLPGWLDGWLESRGLRRSDVKSWAIHPGGPRILARVAECLGLNETDVADSHAVLAGCGNMSSPTLLFIIDRLRRRKASGPAVALGFGPGLVAEGVLFEQ